MTLSVGLVLPGDPIPRLDSSKAIRMCSRLLACFIHQRLNVVLHVKLYDLLLLDS